MNIARTKWQEYRKSQDFLHFAHDEIIEWVKDYVQEVKLEKLRILDIGFGDGKILLKLKAAFSELDVEVYGIESKQGSISIANNTGIISHQLNIENDSLPFQDEYFDVIIANHVIEHLKEIFWLFSEISRVLKKNAIAIIGCPNLGSWHNRLALLMGLQPPAMKLLSGHIRGITKSEFKNFIENEGYFELINFKGSNFYPLPVKINKLASKILPTLSASIHFVIRRTQKPGLFITTVRSAKAINNGIHDTPYYTGTHS